MNAVRFFLYDPADCCWITARGRGTQTIGVAVRFDTVEGAEAFLAKHASLYHCLVVAKRTKR